MTAYVSIPIAGVITVEVGESLTDEATLTEAFVTAARMVDADTRDGDVSHWDSFRCAEEVTIPGVARYTVKVDRDPPGF